MIAADWVAMMSIAAVMGWANAYASIFWMLYT